MVGNSELARFILTSRQQDSPAEPPGYKRLARSWNNRSVAQRGGEPKVTDSAMQRAITAVRDGRSPGMVGAPNRVDDLALRGYIMQLVDKSERLNAPIPRSTRTQSPRS